MEVSTGNICAQEFQRHASLLGFQVGGGGGGDQIQEL